MNFSKNLQILRKRDNMSQEELAEKLDVSRQAVSKWESGGGYPETEKLLKLCELFNCSMDTLLKGNILIENNEMLHNYDKFITKFAKGITIGVLLILLGTTFFLLMIGRYPNAEQIEEKHIITGVSILLIFVLLAVPLFIINGLHMDAFRKKYKTINESYTNEEIEKFDKKFAIVVASSVSLIIIGVILLVLCYGLNIYKSSCLMPVGILMIFITISVPFLVYYGIQKDKFNLEKYNKINSIEIRKSNELLAKISGVLMIITTIIYFILGFIFNLWKYNWILYPISGMICGIFGIILNKEE